MQRAQGCRIVPHRAGQRSRLLDGQPGRAEPARKRCGDGVALGRQVGLRQRAFRRQGVICRLGVEIGAGHHRYRGRRRRRKRRRSPPSGCLSSSRRRRRSIRRWIPFHLPCRTRRSGRFDQEARSRWKIDFMAVFSERSGVSPRDVGCPALTPQSAPMRSPSIKCIVSAQSGLSIAGPIWRHLQRIRWP